MAKVTTINRGELGNTYVYGDEGEPCLVFDLGSNKNDAISEYAAKHHNGNLLAIFLTHGHFDHILGLNDLTLPQRFPIIIGSEDAPCVDDPVLNGSATLTPKGTTIKDGLSYYLCEDEDEIKIGPYFVKVIATPFHTEGSVCYYIEEDGILFSGDTLFRGSIGRSDLPGACPRFQQGSLKKLMALPDETIVYPGHGPKTTIGQERRFNPFLS